MKNAATPILVLRSRLSHGRLTEAEFNQAVAEVLGATSEGLSPADCLLLSHQIRELEREWREKPEASC